MDFTLSDCLFGAAKLTKNGNPYKYSGIVVMILDLMHVYNFYYQMVNSVKMLLFLELIIVLPCILIIETKKS